MFKFYENCVEVLLGEREVKIAINQAGYLNAGSRCSTSLINTYSDPKAGTLSVYERGNECFERVFWITDVPKMGLRGNHAHKECEQTLVGLSGGVDVLLIDNKRHVDCLRLGKFAIKVPPRVWVVLRFHSITSSVMVGCSHAYDPADYIYDITSL